MQCWEYVCRYARINKGAAYVPDPSPVWTEADANGQTEWDHMMELGGQGWELVTVTPVTGYWAGTPSATMGLVYTFKRPLPEKI